MKNVVLALLTYKVGAASKEIKKRSLSEIGINEYEGCAEVDLELTLSLPGSSSGNLALKWVTSRTPLSSSSSQGPCLSSKMDTDHKNVDELPPLIAMGCAPCLIYVMKLVDPLDKRK
ncbi:unnamed protein product [Sphenostylis stenocarpa]|uniref:Uncharacterized protein n=1 Tax=Sphenostylis stenocarpa TaxID=92480 RepID=A0AA86W422_9FABA|nr:unnamed protein product [Sphenostylis stenocarpa]